MAITIKDFILQLGFDSSQVDKGIKSLGVKFNRVSKTIQRSENERNKASKTMFADMLRAEEAQAKAAAKTQRTAQESTAKRIVSQMGFEEMAHRANSKFDSQRVAAQAKAAQSADIRRRRSQTSIERAQRKATFKLGSFGTEASASQLRDVSRQLDVLRAKAKRATSAGDFSKVANSLSLVNQQLDISIAKSGALTRKINAQKFAMNSARDSARNLARSYLSVFAVVAGVGSAVRTGQGFESIQASLLAASGSSEAAARDFEFVKKVSLELGRDLTASAKGFQQIAVSALDAGLSMEQAKDLFLAGSEAATAFGLSTEDTFGVFRAFTQIISKGTVSSEELKQQLGKEIAPCYGNIAA